MRESAGIRRPSPLIHRAGWSGPRPAPRNGRRAPRNRRTGRSSPWRATAAPRPRRALARCSKAAGTAALQRAGHVIGTPCAPSVSAKAGGVTADQLHMGDAREEGRQRRDAAGLGDAARDPDDAVVAAQRTRRGIGIRRLAVVDEDNAVTAADPRLAMRQSRKVRMARAMTIIGETERTGHGGCRRRVLRIVLAGERRNTGRSALPADADHAHRPFVFQRTRPSPLRARHQRQARRRHQRSGARKSLALQLHSRPCYHGGRNGRD